MANAYLDAAYAIQLPHGQKSVLVALANRASKIGECFPSIRCISADTGLGRSTIHAHIKTLVETGHIERFNQYRKDNSQRSNLYKLLISTAKKVKKAVKKTFDHVIDMRKKEFNGKIDAPAPAQALSAEITDAQKLTLKYDNAQWKKVVANIFARVAELYPFAEAAPVLDAINHHLEYWMLAAKDNRRLKLTQGQLRAKFFQKERDFLKFLSRDKTERDFLEFLSRDKTSETQRNLNSDNEQQGALIAGEWF